MGGNAQTVPAHAAGLKEAVVAVDLVGNRQQVGVLSLKLDTDQPNKLAVLFPGSPAVVRPVVENEVMTRSRLTGNFLIRARHFLVDEKVASLIVDCPSDSGDHCASQYQVSKQRQEDVDLLIAEVKKRYPTRQEVWLVGTSMGTLSSSFLPLHNPKGYDGAIHTATITDPFARNSYRELADFDYAKAGRPQVLIHHLNDPCALTPYAGAKVIAEKFQLPLVTVTGGAGFEGPACQANTEHGFRGKEKKVMTLVSDVIKHGKPAVLEIK